MGGHVNVKDATELISKAAEPSQVGEAVAEAAARMVGFGSFAFVPFQPRLLGPADFVIRSSEFPTEALRTVAPGMLVSAQREVAPQCPGSLSGVVDSERHFPPRRFLERTSTYQEYWRPFRLERLLITFMGSRGAPAGFCCLARSRREHAFEAADLQTLEELRIEGGRALEAIQLLGSRDVPRTLDALTQAFPSPAFLFDARGRLQWMSDEGALRLSVESMKFGLSTVVRGNRALEVLSRVARRGSASDPGADGALRAASVLLPGEQLAVRRFQGEDLMLLAVSPAPVGPRALPTGSQGKLTPTELRVARLAIEGHTVLNIAAQLGKSEATVRTHLRRLYNKLGVHSRAELACLMLRGT
jgi:DNA-binding CsgD family transcriptional regulator